MSAGQQALSTSDLMRKRKVVTQGSSGLQWSLLRKTLSCLASSQTRTAHSPHGVVCALSCAGPGEELSAPGAVGDPGGGACPAAQLSCGWEARGHHLGSSLPCRGP